MVWDPESAHEWIHNQRRRQRLLSQRIGFSVHQTRKVRKRYFDENRGDFCLISLTILKIFLMCMSFFIAQMYVVLSENNQSFGSPRFTAERRPDRRAIASAIRGELTNSCVAAPWLIWDPAESVRIQATRLNWPMCRSPFSCQS